jgi:hypothetical protein
MVRATIELALDGKSVDVKNIISLTFSDSAGVKSDRVSVNVMPNFPRPKKGAKLKLTFIRGSISLECGLFHVQTVTRTNAKALSFSATGVEFSDVQKDRISHHYQNTKLSSIVDIVAKRLVHKVKFQTDDVEIKSLNQTNESDINFLDRLAKEYNSLASVKDDFVYFVDKDDDDLPLSKIDVSRCSSSSLKHSSKTFYKSCEASWHDVDEAKLKSVTVGAGSPVLKIQGSYLDAEDALVKAKAKLKSVNKGTVSGSLSLAGTKIYAGTKVELFNTYDGEDDGVYSVVSATHKYSRNVGWSTDVEIEN